MEAFDGITYDKGAAVLAMLEHMDRAADVFQRGVESYLRENAWKAATDERPARARSRRRPGKDVAQDRGDVPRPARGPQRDARDRLQGEPTLTLTQAPWHASSATPAAGDGAPWRSHDLRASSEELRVLLTDATGHLLRSRSAPRRRPERRRLRVLPVFARRERVGGVRRGRREAGRRDAARLRQQPVGTGEIRNARARNPPSRAAGTRHRAEPGRGRRGDRGARPARRRARERGGQARLRAVRRGPSRPAPESARRKAKPKAPPSEDDVLERRAIFTALGQLANDAPTLAEANKLALAWLADPTSVDGDLARVAVTLGSRKAGAERIDALRAAMKAAKNPNDRKTALLALSDFDDPATLGKALSVALGDEVRTQDVASIILSAASHPSTRAAAIDWTMANWDAVRTKLPGVPVGSNLRHRRARADEGGESTGSPRSSRRGRPTSRAPSDRSRRRSRASDFPRCSGRRTRQQSTSSST